MTGSSNNNNNNNRPHHRHTFSHEVGLSGIEHNPTNWKWRDIQWKQVFNKQDYANLVGTIIIGAVTATITFHGEPRTLDYYYWDATISHPYGGAPTVPEWVIIFIPIAMAVLTLAVGELMYSRMLHRSLTDALATMFHFFLDLLQSFVYTVFMTQVSKYVGGALRPDFLSRCSPIIPANATINPYQPSNYPCTYGGDRVQDGRLSFPSGHASVGFNVTVYASAYQIWCFNIRRAWMYDPQLAKRSFWQKFKADSLNVIAKYWMLGMISFAWLVSLTRTTDYQHHYADIVAGAFIGTLFALVYIMRAIPRYKRVLAPDVSIQRGVVGGGNNNEGSVIIQEEGEFSEVLVAGAGGKSGCGGSSSVMM